MLQLLEQQQAGYAPIEFLIDFVRALIRIHPGQDGLYLALQEALGKHSLTEEQVKAFVSAILGEVKQSPWPKGFF